MKVYILRNGGWPELEENSKTTVPNELVNYTKLFEKFYKSKYKDNRKLKWLMSQGKSQLNAKYDNKRRY